MVGSKKLFLNRIRSFIIRILFTVAVVLTAYWQVDEIVTGWRLALSLFLLGCLLISSADPLIKAFVGKKKYLIYIDNGNLRGIIEVSKTQLNSGDKFLLWPGMVIAGENQNIFLACGRDCEIYSNERSFETEYGWLPIYRMAVIRD